MINQRILNYIKLYISLHPNKILQYCTQKFIIALAYIAFNAWCTEIGLWAVFTHTPLVFSWSEHAHNSHPEACTIPKDGGAMSNGDSYAAKKSTTDCLQAWSSKKWGMKLGLTIQLSINFEQNDSALSTSPINMGQVWSARVFGWMVQTGWIAGSHTLSAQAWVLGEM